MKKIIALLVLTCSLHALYFGCPAEPRLIDEGFWMAADSFLGVKLGYEGDAVFDRKMRASGGASGRIDRFKSTYNQGVLTFSILDRFEAYASYGAMNVSFWHRPRIDKERREYESHDQWTVGTGAKLILYQWGNTVLGADGKFQYGQPRFKWATVNGVSHATGARLVYSEWQAGLALSHTIDMFTPYLGGTYSEARGHFDRIRHVIYPRSHFKMHSRDKWGLVLGCAFTTGKKFDLNIEGQFFSEQGATIAANIKL
jgi:hypothetical protein